MNLAEFRKALSSDATEENAQLKKQLSDLQTKHHEKLSKLERICALWPREASSD